MSDFTVILPNDPEQALSPARIAKLRRHLADTEAAAAQASLDHEAAQTAAAMEAHAAKLAEEGAKAEEFDYEMMRRDTVRMVAGVVGQDHYQDFLAWLRKTAPKTASALKRGDVSLAIKERLLALQDLEPLIGQWSETPSAELSGLLIADDRIVIVDTDDAEIRHSIAYGLERAPVVVVTTPHNGSRPTFTIGWQEGAVANSAELWIELYILEKKWKSDEDNNRLYSPPSSGLSIREVTKLLKGHLV